jgi:hypothetical protein
MKLVRGRGEARCFPSRHNFALFRLAAYLRLALLRRRHPEGEPVDGIFVLDRNQSSGETYAVAAWLTLTLTCYLAATLFGGWPVALALAAALPVAFIGVEVPMILSALAIAPILHRLRPGSKDITRVNSFVLMLAFIAASAYFAVHATWVRFAGRQVLAVVAANAGAAVIVFFLKEPIARLEASIGGASSGD